MAMFPLGTVLFPGSILPLHIFEPRYRRMIADCLEGNAGFGVVLIARGSEVGGGDVRVALGTEARIEHAVELPDGRWTVIASGTRRLVVESWLPDDPYPEAVVRPADDGPSAPSRDALEAASRAVRSVIALLSELGRGRPLEGPLEVTPEAPARTQLGWRLCDIAPLGPLDRQRLLGIDNADARLATLTELTGQVADDLHRLLAEGETSS